MFREQLVRQSQRGFRFSSPHLHFQNVNAARSHIFRSRHRLLKHIRLEFRYALCREQFSESQSLPTRKRHETRVLHDLRKSFFFRYFSIFQLHPGTEPVRKDRQPQNQRLFRFLSRNVLQLDPQRLGILLNQFLNKIFSQFFPFFSAKTFIIYRSSHRRTFFSVMRARDFGQTAKIEFLKRQKRRNAVVFRFPRSMGKRSGNDLLKFRVKRTMDLFLKMRRDFPHIVKQRGEQVALFPKGIGPEMREPAVKQFPRDLKGGR